MIDNTSNETLLVQKKVILRDKNNLSVINADDKMSDLEAP